MIAHLHETARMKPAAEAATDRIVVVFRNDDPSAISDVDHERRVYAMFERFGVPQTIGVIPNVALGAHRDPHAQGERALETNPDIVALLRQHCDRVGSEISLHGFTHRTSPLSIPSRREYFEFRDEGAAAQADKLSRGIEILSKSLRVRPVTFIPPWNRLDRDTVTACEQNGLSILSAGPYAPTAAGVASLGTDCDLFNFPAFLEQALASNQRVFLRILFHSCTTRTPEELAALERALTLATQSPQCSVMTIEQAVERHRDEIAVVNEAGRNVIAQDMLHGSGRASAVLCRRVAARVLGRDRVGDLLSESERLYRGGHYAEAVRLGQTVDAASVRMVMGWFVALAALGALTGGLGAWIVRSASDPARVLTWAAMTGLTSGAAELLRWRGTAPDTRRQIRASGWAFMLGLNAAFLAVEILQRIL